MKVLLGMINSHGVQGGGPVARFRATSANTR